MSRKLAKERREQGDCCKTIAQELGVSVSTIYRWTNPLREEKMRAAGQKWREKNKSHRREYYREYENHRRSEDLDFRLRKALRNRLRMAIRKQQKTGSAVSDLGCSIEELKQHLESQFRGNMSWENYGQWEIDHIKPVSRFDLADREQFLQANHYTNLQPLWADENLSKGSYYADTVTVN